MSVLERGDKVRARSPDDEYWYVARLLNQNIDGTWVVAWEDPAGGPETDVVDVDGIEKMYFYTDYQVGDDCRIMPPDDDNWYPGTVAALLGDNRFRVSWGEPDATKEDETTDVHYESMKRLHVRRDWTEGAQVLATFPGDRTGSQFEAKVVKRNGDGTFTVEWDDPDGGPEESVVRPVQMRARPLQIANLQVGQQFTGTVARVDPRGWAFVDIGAEAHGFLHRSDICGRDAPRVDDFREHLQEGQEVTVWFNGLRDNGHEFRLSMVEPSRCERASLDVGDQRSFAGLDSSRFLEGRVTAIKEGFGALVQVAHPRGGAPAEGRLHITNIREDFGGNLHEELSVGQEVQVRVVHADASVRRMVLSMKPAGRVHAI